MSLTIDYYFAPQSPWTYLGHARLTDLAAQFKAQVNVLPVDLGGKVFPISGGLPLGARAPQRQAYRLVELKRFSEFLSQPLHIKPKYFPVAGDDAARLIVAVRQHDGDAAAMKITGAVPVWSRRSAKARKWPMRPTPSRRLMPGFLAPPVMWWMARFFGAKTDSAFWSAAWPRVDPPGFDTGCAYDVQCFFDRR